LHTTINQTVASTGRLSTTSPNLQSIPIRTPLGREIRSAFVAEEGAKLLSADYSQIELRILAHVSGEPKLREAFARREDLQAARDSYVTSLLGRRRPVPEIRAANRQTRSLGERLAVNFVMQGSNADIIKVAMIRIHRRLRDEGRAARLVLQVHDELLLEVPEAEVGAVRELVRAEMCG